MEPRDATHDIDRHGAGVGHEQRDVAFRPLVHGLLALVALIVVSVILMRLVFGFLVERAAKESPPANPLAQSFGRQVPPEPRLQSDPLQDLRALHAEEDAVLNNYGWVDRKTGVVRIPVQRALELVAQRGLPARQPAPAAGGQ
jgi:hypothetical protein